MSKDATGFLIFIGISLIVSLVCHWRMRRYFIASLCAAIVSAVAFHLVVFLRLGYPDPFAFIALGVGAAIAFAIAAVTGIPFARHRRQRSDERLA